MKKEQIVLIVEDEPVNRKILRKLPESHYTLLEAENGAEAWKIIAQRGNELSAILLDLIMPVMDGYELLEKIRDARLEELPIIVTTGATDVGTEQKALESGAWDFVTKPYNPKVLLSRLGNAIARSRVSMFEEMQHMAEHDKLTGLHNREKMFANTRSMLDENPEKTFAFARIDIDHFALYNTSFGESEGDRLLKFLSDCIVETAEQYPLCTFGRMSADIFCACFLYDGNEQNLRDLIGHVQERLAAYRSDYRLEISVGVCLVDDPSLSVDDFYFRSTVASKKCKNQYATHLSFYDSAAGKEISAEVLITNEMQAALDDGQFVVYLQPKFSLATESACGAEALVRWLHPTRGLVSPGEFIPVFERNGFISKLDYFVWERTCQMLSSWSKTGKTPFPVSVNISRISLYNPQLAELMTGLVQKYGISPSLLQLEVTESAYMTNPELMETTIDSLRNAGFTILMDDFGSGYSSLNTLKSIRVDILKVDMKFLPVGDETERGEIILACVIKMANWLGMTVVVEGVETRRQRDFLEGAGCDCVQGYYYSKPIPQAEYEEKYVGRSLPSPHPEREDALVASPQHNMTILVIDDSEMDRDILHENLKSHYHVHLCESAEEGLAYLKRNMSKVKLVLVDNCMRGMNGLEFFRHCAQDTTLAAIPKIMITANDSVEDQVIAFREGAYDYITKPFRKEIILARVAHVMEISRRTSIFDAVEQGYRQQAELDPATKLLNKMAFRELCSKILASYPEDQEALLVLDIDDFKQINDSFGHLAGDKVLCCIADELTNAFRKTDVIGRFGGDEFVVLMTKLPSLEVARLKAAEIIKSVMFSCSKQLHISTSISVGISYSEHGDTVDTLFARADQALYEAKSTGKNKAVVYGEKVPPIIDDDKPVVLICSEDPQLYPTIALAYGSGAAFASVTSYGELTQTFEKYF